ncbi:DUF7338 family protein [Methylomonas fluvii]|uniref:Uncharacterized protein n=1 Tax=Methylomonas fluvii TaxID=1854564 RepID=A0ABR9DIJ6_9GAMM|nr:hypothetical protein [Methylomonas fluvii]MBD9362938.1 hypothetical protein [Methylomonas fluvii]
MKTFAYLVTHLLGASLVLMHKILPVAIRLVRLWATAVLGFRFGCRLVQWLVYLPLHVFLVVFVRPWLAWVAVKWFGTANKLDLHPWLRWFMTPDNPLSGDNDWQTKHIAAGSDPLSDENRIAWLRRNGFNWFNYHVLGCRNDSVFELFNLAIQNTRWFWLRDDGYWMLRAYIPVGNQYLNLFWGWSLFGEIDGYCKFTLTTRFKDDKPE